MTTEPADRRTRILDAALACFLEHGYAATSIADIRARSGASTGSIYHFFANKGALAAALVQRAVAGWSAETAVVTADMPAETAIKASVLALVRWGLGHPAERRFIDEMRSLALTDPTLGECAELFRRGTDAAATLFAVYQQRNEVRDLPWPIAHALMLGPAYDFLRQAEASPQNPGAAALLADAAWASVRSLAT